MPAAISFAFPEAMMAAPSTSSDGGKPVADGADLFGQLLGAGGAVMEGEAAVDTAMAALALKLASGAADTADAPNPMMSTAFADAVAAVKSAEGKGQAPLNSETAEPLMKASAPAAPTAQPEGQAAHAAPLISNMVQTAKPPVEADQSDDALERMSETTDESAALSLPTPQPVVPQRPPPSAPIVMAANPIVPDQADGVAADTDLLAMTSNQSLRKEAALQAEIMPSSKPVAAEREATFQTAQQNQSQSAPPPSATVRVDSGEGSLPAALLTQSMAPLNSAPATTNPYAASLPAAPAEPVVHVRAGQMGADVGMEIAKVAKGDGDSVLIRLDPRELGRVDVRLSFDRDGILRAVMSVDSPSALEMLRRESGDLNRALADAGVRSDSQSLRFDARSGEGTGQGNAPWREARSGGGRGQGDGDGMQDHGTPDYQPLRTSSQIDLFA